MKVSKELVLAYVDGELDAVDAARVEQAMRDDVETESAVASARALRDRLRMAYAPVLDEPVPARLLAAASAGAESPARDSDNVVPLRPSSAPTATPGRAWRLPHWVALAASLLVGVLMAPLLSPKRSPAMLDSSGGALVAAGELARTLGTRVAADRAQGVVAVGLSFRDADGRYCRTFTLGGDAAIAGLACRDDRAWQVVALGESRADAGDLRRATSALPPAILAEVDARLRGEPLDEAGERKARDAGWR